MWKEVSPSTVKQYFEKCGFRKGDYDLMEADKVDLEFSTLLKELLPDVPPGNYVDFYAEFSTVKPEINVDTLGWRQ